MSEKMSSPKISVIMGVYNQWDEAVLLESVESILNQTFEDFEFIIWDDGSHPDVARMVQSLSDLDSRIRIAGKGENKGLAYSLNECIQLARGKYIARMDADDISLPTRLERQYDFLEKNPSYAWCGCNTRLFDKEGMWGVRKMPEEPRQKDYLRFSPYVHPTVMYRTEIFDTNAGYLESEETLRCEDYEIFMRLSERGLKGCNLQENLFCYREDKAHYRNRKFRYRLNESKLRYRNFKKMGILFPVGWAYVIRPLIGGLLPVGIIALWKRKEATIAQKKQEGRRYDKESAIRTVSQYTLKEATASKGFAGMSK